MPYFWHDYLPIATALRLEHPDADVSTLPHDKLRLMVVELADFGDQSQPPSDRWLDLILYAWIKLVQDDVLQESA